MNKIELLQQLKMSNLKIKSIQDRFIKTPIRIIKIDGTILKIIKYDDSILKINNSDNITEIKEKIRISEEMFSYLDIQNLNIQNSDVLKWGVMDNGEYRLCYDISPSLNSPPIRLVPVEGMDNLFEMPDQREARIQDTGSAFLS